MKKKSHRSRSHKTSNNSSGHRKTSRKDPRKTSDVVLVEKVHRTFVSSRGPNQTSDEDLPEDLTRIEIDMRHYCRHCGRKRAERHMHIVGQGAFGKKSWACLDTSECQQVKKLKADRA